MRHGVNFLSYEKQVFKSFSCTKIRNDSKLTKTSRTEVIRQRFTTNFPHHVHNQAGFDNPFIH